VNDDRVRQRARLRRVAVLVLWALVVLGWWRYQRSTGGGFTDAAQRFVDAARGAWWAVPAFVAIFLVRPFILFPPAALALAAGVLFGPVAGSLVVLVALNLSGTVAWFVGRSLGRPAGTDDDRPSSSSGTGVRVWVARLHANAFGAVLLMRLVLIPFDVVNYLCGYLRVKWAPFALATAIGVVPSTIAIVLAGASVDRLDEGTSGLDPRLLVASAVLVVASVVVALVLRRRQHVTG
jgi:uncharacterized membrane protein YdjX (TVP38/TMEM64 family)